MAAHYRYRPGRRKPHVVVVRSGGRETSEGYETEEEARETLEALTKVDDVREGFGTPFAVGISEACRGWLEVYRPTLSSSWQRTAGTMIEQHIAPHFDELALSRLDDAALLGFIDSVLSKKKGKGENAKPVKGIATIRNSFAVLNRVCEIYVEKDILQRNPMKGARALLSRVEQNRSEEVASIQAWTREEMGTLLDLAAEHEPATFGPLLCAFHTGMRQSEIFGLQWRDVDFARRRIQVLRSLVEGEYKVPKSGKSRVVPMSEVLAAELLELADRRESREGIHTDPGPVFQPMDGGAWDRHHFAPAWKRLRRRAAKDGVRPLRFHDTRHTFATLALRGGKSAKWVQVILGHHSAAFTLGVYAHVLDEDLGEVGFLDGGGRKGANGGKPRRLRSVSP